MIIVLGKDPEAIKSLYATQANGAVATFGARSTLGLYNPTLARNENLFLVADLVTFNASRAPAIGDVTGVWTVQQIMSHLEGVFPQGYGGNVFLAARQVDQRGSCWDFAGMLKTMLGSGMRGSVSYHPGSLLGPIPAPGDRRWTAVSAIPLVSSPTPVGPLQEGQPADPLLTNAA